MEHAAVFHKQYTEAEYLALDSVSQDKKYEFYGGEILAMAGADLAHNTICANIIRELGVEIIKQQRPCRVLTSDQRVRAVIKENGEIGYCYPDVVVVCGTPELADTTPKTLLNPAIIVEVLSKTNSGREIMEKLRYYSAIASLTDLLLVDSEAVHLMHYEHLSYNEWRVHSFHSLDQKVILLPHRLELSLAEVYRNVELSPRAPR